MGCAFGNEYRQSHDEAWRRVEQLDPDVALLQECGVIPEWVDPSRIASRPRNEGGRFHTIVYARRGTIQALNPDPILAPMLAGQAVMAEVNLDGASPILFASVHARTGSPEGVDRSHFDALADDERARLALPADTGSWNATSIYTAIARAATQQRTIVGGDFNLAWRFDETDGAPRFWAAAQFRAMRELGWRRPHLKFHAGEERTLFRKDRPHELFQLDHFFTDAQTYAAATSCEVVQIEDLERLSDHAPLMLAVDNEAMGVM